MLVSVGPIVGPSLGLYVSLYVLRQTILGYMKLKFKRMLAVDFPEFLSLLQKFEKFWNNFGENLRDFEKKKLLENI